MIFPAAIRSVTFLTNALYSLADMNMPQYYQLITHLSTSRIV